MIFEKVFWKSFTLRNAKRKNKNIFSFKLDYLKVEVTT